MLVTAATLGGESAGAADVKTQPSEEELLEVLRTGSPEHKALACKQLALYGGKNSCPALAALLVDSQLASWARIALEAIPDPAADDVLRNSLSAVDGALAVGVINSIGARRDVSAVKLLVEYLDDDDTQVASAAAVALGHIGNSSAADALQKALSNVSDDVLPAVSEGYLLCADRLLAGKNLWEAAAIYDEVRATSVPKPQKLAATYGVILARGNDGIPLLIEQLKASDRQYFQIGLTLVRELPNQNVVDELSRQLTNFPGDRAALILLALAQRDDASISEEVFAAATSGEKQTRLAAMDFIGRRGNESHVDALLEFAAEGDAELARGAMDALTALPGQKVDEHLIAKARLARDKQLLVLIDAMGRRRTKATSELCNILNNSNPSIREVTLKALGESVGAKELSVLINEVASPRSPADAKNATLALKSAAIRMQDREVCAAEIAAALPTAPLEAKINLLNVLGAVGGKVSLVTISDAMHDGEDLQDAGSRLLGEWMSADAAPVLLEQVKTVESNKFKIRALRGYIRIARQFQMHAAERADMCRSAMMIANRVEEQQLVLAILARYPDIEMLKIAVEATAIPAIKQTAEQTAVKIADALGRTPEVTAVLSRGVQVQK